MVHHIEYMHTYKQWLYYIMYSVIQAYILWDANGNVDVGLSIKHAGHEMDDNITTFTKTTLGLKSN